MYDYEQFGGVTIFEPDDEDFSRLEDNGVYRVTNEGHSIDFFANGISEAKDTGVILVCFGGALRQRDGVAGPFFSGRGLRSRVKVPFIGISDPILERCPDLLLSWYAGCPASNGLPRTIARHLDAIADHYGCRLILVGGSGGGFAVLNVQQHLNARVRSLIWNPQTNISKYRVAEVAKYIRAISGKDSEVTSSEEASLLLKGLGVSFDVTKAAMKNGEVIYLQNDGDNHVKHHMRPLMKRGNWQEVGERIWHEENRNIFVALTQWGKGHVAMPKKDITASLIAIKNEKSSLDVIRAAQSSSQ